MFSLVALRLIPIREAETKGGSMDDLEYKILLSCKYHRERESFFTLLDIASKVISLLAISSLAVTPFTQTFNWVIAGLSVIFTIMAICCDFAGRAAKHKSLAGRFADLRKKFHEGVSAQTLTAEMMEIQINEPPVVKSVAQKCQDELDYSLGELVPKDRLGFWRRLRAPFGFGVYKSLHGK